MDQGIARAVRAGGGRPGRRRDPGELCDAAVSGALDHRDDVAVIAVRFG